LSNASKHSPTGAEIRVELQQANETALIRVVDRGVGIPADQLERVFEMFTKIERGSTDANDGLGIGLSLSRHLVQLHQGNLSVSSAGDGQGATFTLAIPLRHVTGAGNDTPALGLAPSSAAPLPPPASAAPNGSATSALRVVVVEDNDDSADMMCIWVERLGHQVRVARNGPEGLDVIMASQPDVVLCDIGLPGMDGVELCRRVIGGLHTPPLMVALTGWGMEADRARTADAGFRHHLVKPVAMDQLRDVLLSVRR
ncbi:MAG TPA: ATP-binding protein, partial [Polyangiaceae bacterium]|nr:ATP-binding protein [Polyangiaceae bacterium]